MLMFAMLKGKEFSMLQASSEHERNLWIASRRYVMGEIEIDELEAVELIESENFKNAVQALARRQLRQQFRYKFLKLWKIGGRKK